MRLKLIVLMLCMASVANAQTRRALIVGIDDYTASSLPRNMHVPPRVDRGWNDLRGSVRDAETFSAILQLLYGFNERNVVLLKNQNATRAAILNAIETHLVKPAQKDDVIVFYYAGHGAQVPNSLSDEVDHMDESLIPADSRRGAPDIRDKELRRAFNAILDRGARLTLILDHCHSGSSFRGLPTGGVTRHIAPAPDDIRDGANYGPRPESRGALVFAASQDLDSAYETRDENGQMHGAFSWALIRSIRDAMPHESAEATFTRTKALMDRPDQQPLIAGRPELRQRPLFSGRNDRRSDRAMIAVEKIQTDGTVILQGGWIHGLAVGTTLRTKTATVTITKLGITSSEARANGIVTAGALLEVSSWASPPARPMRVYVPHTTLNAAALSSTAQKFIRDATARGIRWITNPQSATPTHVLRWTQTHWELLTNDGSVRPFTNMNQIPRRASLFVQFPATTSIVDNIAGVNAVQSATDADYILTGRYINNHIEYAWLRPLIRTTDRGPLPPRSEWISRDVRSRLRESVVQLRRIHAWHHLESPPQSRPVYRLAVQDETGRAANVPLIGNANYRVALKTDQPDKLATRYYYAFVIDRLGKSFLIYPLRNSGSVENRFPIRTPETTIKLPDASRFRILPPYGTDTYFLLSTDEPLANPSVLEWDGIRTPTFTKPLTALEELFLLTTDPTRGRRVINTGGWSLEKVVYESIAPRKFRH